MKARRDFLKDTVRKEVDFRLTAQSRGYLPPPVEKPVPDGTSRIKLPRQDNWMSFGAVSLVEAVTKRSSYRKPTKGKLSFLELSFLLWATQGVTRKELPLHAFKVVPSAGCRHSFESYIAAIGIEGLEQGVYRYLPLSHELIAVRECPDIGPRVTLALLGQDFAGESAAVFFWTAIPARMEWRYAEAAHKVIALDAGHVCQNLYLAGQAADCGICAIAAYDQELCDELVMVDGDDEFTIYAASVSKR